MAQAKRKRQTKHRGNAAGVIESRGRTGRAPTAAEKRGEARKTGAQGRTDRFDKPPSWRSAFNRSAIAAGLMFVAMLVLTHNTVQAIVLFPIVLLIYVPLSYYTDNWMYERRKRSKARKAAEGKAASR